MTTPCLAWLLTPYGVPPFAVAGHHMIEYVSAVTPYEVPVTPAHCPAVIEWRQRFVPFMELGGLFGQRAEGGGQEAVVLAYQTEPGTPLHYVAVAVQEAPVRLSVTDDMACDLPDSHQELWHELATSCFSRAGIPTPIISVTQLCSEAFRCYVESLPEVVLAQRDSNTMRTLVDAAPAAETPARRIEETASAAPLLRAQKSAVHTRPHLEDDGDDGDEDMESTWDMLDAVDEQDGADEDEDDEGDDTDFRDEDDDEGDEDDEDDEEYDEDDEDDEDDDDEGDDDEEVTDAQDDDNEDDEDPDDTDEDE